MKKAIQLFILLACSILTFAQSNTEKNVSENVEAFHKAMIAADGNILSELCAEKLSYGHSAGQVEDKKEFIRKITSGENIYDKIKLDHQTISISGKAAVVRTQFEAETRANGKSGTLKLLVLMVWQKQHGKWKLLARQAVKITA
jgi:ketosteroid isomerase-like protein